MYATRVTMCVCVCQTPQPCVIRGGTPATRPSRLPSLVPGPTTLWEDAIARETYECGGSVGNAPCRAEMVDTEREMNHMHVMRLRHTCTLPYTRPWTHVIVRGLEMYTIVPTELTNTILLPTLPPFPIYFPYLSILSQAANFFLARPSLIIGSLPSFSHFPLLPDFPTVENTHNCKHPALFCSCLLILLFFSLEKP